MFEGHLVSIDLVRRTSPELRVLRLEGLNLRRGRRELCLERGCVDAPVRAALRRWRRRDGVGTDSVGTVAEWGGGIVCVRGAVDLVRAQVAPVVVLVGDVDPRAVVAGVLRRVVGAAARPALQEEGCELSPAGSWVIDSESSLMRICSWR